MRKQMIEDAAFEVATQVRTVEELIDSTLTELAELQGKMVRVRAVSGCGVLTGQSAFEKLAEATQALVGARGSVGNCHAALVDAKNAYRLRGLSTYAQDGVSLTNDWLGAPTGGTGRVIVGGINYKLSLAAILRAPAPFWGDGPDLVFEAAYQAASINSDDPGFDERFKQKAGLDVLYTFIPWMGVGLRMDRVAPNSKDPEETFYALAPRLQLRSNWLSHETVTLKYSKWFYGKHTHSDGWDARPREQLDDQMLGLGFGMWW